MKTFTGNCWGTFGPNCVCRVDIFYIGLHGSPRPDPIYWIILKRSFNLGAAKAFYLQKRGKWKDMKLIIVCFISVRWVLRHNMRWLKNARFHKRKLRFLLSFTIRRSSYKSQASVTAPLGPPSLDLTTEFDLLNGKIISKAHNQIYYQVPQNLRKHCHW